MQDFFYYFDQGTESQNDMAAITELILSLQILNI